MPHMTVSVPQVNSSVTSTVREFRVVMIIHVLLTLNPLTARSITKHCSCMSYTRSADQPYYDEHHRMVVISDNIPIMSAFNQLLRNDVKWMSHSIFSTREPRGLCSLIPEWFFLKHLVQFPCFVFHWGNLLTAVSMKRCPVKQVVVACKFTETILWAACLHSYP
jgi:hypothetical protein